MDAVLPMELRSILFTEIGCMRCLRRQLVVAVSKGISILLPISLSLLACADGKEGPFLTAQLCVRNEDGLMQLVAELKAVAAAKGMMFVDNSADTQRDLEVVGYADRYRTDGDPVFNVAVKRRDGPGVGATNLGLPSYQIALGFTEGINRVEAEKFTNEVISTLEKYWFVEKLPAGVGATPNSTCK